VVGDTRHRAGTNLLKRVTRPPGDRRAGLDYLGRRAQASRQDHLTLGRPGAFLPRRVSAVAQRQFRPRTTSIRVSIGRRRRPPRAVNLEHMGAMASACHRRPFFDRQAARAPTVLVIEREWVLFDGVPGVPAASVRRRTAQRVLAACCSFLHPCRAIGNRPGGPVGGGRWSSFNPKVLPPPPVGGVVLNKLGKLPASFR